MRSAAKVQVIGALFAGGLLLQGCGGAPKRPPMPTPEAGVVTLAPETVTLTTTLPGRTSPTAVADVRPQVGGIIKKRQFVEGAEVKTGQTLYLIDPAPYQAAFDQARGQLASAEAQVAAAKNKEERYADLLKINGVSRQDYDDARAAALEGAAAVAQARASVETARINLGYTEVKAPISGRTGRSAFTQGALVSAAQTSALTTIQTLDPIYVDISQSAGDLINLRRRVEAGALSTGGASAASVALKFEDGSDYPQRGRLEFAEVTVDQTTGAVALRAVFPNPKGVLLPGLFVRAVVEEGVRANALLAPAQGVALTPTGQPTAFVVGPDGRAEIRYLKTEGMVGGRWLVTDGLRPGDRLIVEGLQRIRPASRFTRSRRAPRARAPPEQLAGGPPMGNLSRFFIERPIFAWVLAVITMLAGTLAIFALPVAQYPTIAPPAVTITATYPGADAATLEAAVTQVIEQQLKGLDHLLYFSSTSQSNGQVVITATFTAGANPDIAQVQVQNKLQQATPLLPTQVQQQGVVVAKASNSILLVVGAFDTNGRNNGVDVADFVSSKLQDPISRIPGVGDLQIFGGQYAMRIWLDPYKLDNYGLTVADVSAAVSAQNVQVSAGEIGALPAVPGQTINATVTLQSRLHTADEFRAIILKTAQSGALVRLGDVARVELGAEIYDFISRYNRHPAAGMAVKLAPNANALETVAAVKRRVDQLRPSFPAGIAVDFPVDSTAFVKLSIHDVVQTLVVAILLVVAVMFLFLQNWRATLIPAVAVPVVLLGSFAVLAAAGFSINTLTLFALVLAIGLLVDDAIVVVENVERIMSEEGLSPKEATIKSMGEITGALVGIALVLSAVFLPMAFFPGSTGVIYRQFSITIVSAMALSVAVALVLTPALCATLLRPVAKGEARAERGFFGWFNRTFAGLVARYERTLGRVLKRSLPAVLLWVGLVVVLAVLFVRMPSGFIPEEDQGQILVQFSLPPGAVAARSQAVVTQIEHQLFDVEGANIKGGFVVNGFNFGGSGQNLGLAFVQLRDWKDRKGAKNSAAAIAGRSMGAFSRIRDAQVFAFVPPSVRELGNANGFDFELEDVGGVGHGALLAARNQLLGMAASDPKLFAVRPNGQEDAPELHVDVDRAKAGALGLSLADVDATLSTAWGSTYINQFVDRGRVKKVFMQGDAPYRMSPSDLERWFVRTSSGTMAPFSAFATTRWTLGPTRLEHYNGNPSMELQGQSAPGFSSGAAMEEMDVLARRLPPGISYEWTGLSYQEEISGAQAPALYGLSLIAVFLCLAALYESWSIPAAVMLIIPLGVAGAVVAATLRGLYNDIYFQVGLLTTIGLSAKNAILIVEFAVASEKDGMTPFDAAMHAAKIRLRPVLMTSLAFIAGVFPLAISTGAGAGSQNDIGTGVIGGMLAATVLAIFFVPLFFVLIRGVFRSRRPADQAGRIQTAEG